MDDHRQYKSYPHYHGLIKVPPLSGSLPRFPSWRASLLLCDLLVQDLSLPEGASFSSLEDLSIYAFSIFLKHHYFILFGCTMQLAGS